jgi:predicted dehydrogenase
MNTRGVVIVGGGARGLLFSEILEKNLNTKVFAIVEKHIPSWDLIRTRLQENGIKDVDLFETFEEMFNKYPPQIVEGLFIMTPEWAHIEIFRKATRAGYHIFLEKPIATTAEDIKEIYEISRTYPYVIQIGFVLRYSIFYRKIKEIIESGILGKLLVLQLNERLTLQHGAKFKRSWHSKTKYTGGFLNEKCSHDLDLIRWFKGSQSSLDKLVSFAGKGFALERERFQTTYCVDCKINCPFRDTLDSYPKYYNGKVLLDETSPGIGKCIYINEADIYDYQSVMIHFKDGAQATFTTIAMSGDPGRDIMIHGSDGYLFGELEKGNLYVQNYLEGSLQKIELNQLDAHGGGDEEVVAQFLSCVRHGTHPVASVKDGYLASLLAFKADESVLSGSIVDLSREFSE